MQEKPIINIPETEKKLKAITSTARVERLVSALGDARLYLVGGIVRDSLLGKASDTDIDIAINISADKCLNDLNIAGVRVYTTGLKHDTLTAVPVDGEPAVEITSFRNNAQSIEDDLRARDFTINAIAYDIQSEKLSDPLHGKDDLEKGLVRACGDAHTRFGEDPLRIFRMVRFSSCLNFTIDQDTYETAKGYLAQNGILTVSIERIRDELSKILISPQPIMGIKMLAELGLLKAILPEIDAFIGYEQNEYHKHDLFNHTLQVVQNTLKFAEPDVGARFAHPDMSLLLGRANPAPTIDQTETENRYSSLILRLAALLHDVGKPESLSVDNSGRRHFYCHEVAGINIARNILKRLKYANEIQQAVLMLIRTHMRPLNCGDGGLRRILRDTGSYYEEWRQLKEADSLGCKIDEQEAIKDLEEFDVRIARIRQEQLAYQFKLALNGKDIIALGFKEGPKIGKIIKKLTDIVLDNPELNTKERLTEIICRGRW